MFKINLNAPTFKVIGSVFISGILGVSLTLAASGAPVHASDDADFCDAVECAEEIKQFRRYALNGSSAAMLLLAVAHANGEGVPQDIDEARKWMKESIRMRNSQAFHIKSNWRRHGIVFEQDEAQADYWLQRAVEANYAPALHEMSVRNLQAGVADDETINMLEEAAEWGHTESMYLLARLLEANLNQAENAMAAGQLYKELAFRGYRDSEYRLGRLVTELEATADGNHEIAQQLRELDNMERIEVRAFYGDFHERLAQLRTSMDERFKYRPTGTRIRRARDCEDAGGCNVIYDRHSMGEIMGPANTLGGLINPNQ